MLWQNSQRVFYENESTVVSERGACLDYIYYAYILDI
jgi:hypothetical protein